MPLWWNGRHKGLKIPRQKYHTGSSPVSGTTNLTFKKFFVIIFIQNAGLVFNGQHPGLRFISLSKTSKIFIKIFQKFEFKSHIRHHKPVVGVRISYLAPYFNQIYLYLRLASNQNNTKSHSANFILYNSIKKDLM